MARTVTPAALRDSLDEVLVVDTRSPARYREGHVPGAVNYPFAVDGDLDADDFRTATGADESTRIVTVCGAGASSTELAEALDAAEFDAAVVDGGMAAWRKASGPEERDESAG